MCKVKSFVLGTLFFVLYVGGILHFSDGVPSNTSEVVQHGR